ncbi:glutamate--cysteine ligase, partial [Salmonella enterica]|uniref:glutamate--cysteine ligase n=1 Tax=Salmonella enterica TaxID=28901 RepID=UPI003FA691EF
ARTGEQELADKVAAMLDQIRAKYKEYNISDEPFVVVKADAGTYGMGVMTVKDAAELIGLNRKQRNKMSVVKEGLEVHDVIIQEGVHTFETVNNAVA